MSKHMSGEIARLSSINATCLRCESELRFRATIPATPTSEPSSFHIPVLAEQAIRLLVTDPDGTYVDCTVGGGGHSLLIIRELSSAGRLIGVDRDREALEFARSRLPSSVVLHHCQFGAIGSRFGESGTFAAGVLLDLGISSHQIDAPERGFSHRFPGPLDLRMDQTSGERAADLLARLTIDELRTLLFRYGEEPQAKRIATAIIREREREPIRTTDALARIINTSVPATRIKSLARVFQALRIAVNHELDELPQGLAAAWDILKPGGRLVVISYHSLEDRIVKGFMKAKAETAVSPIGVVVTPATGNLLLRKPAAPAAEEIALNPRARSARLRAIEKTI